MDLLFHNLPRKPLIFSIQVYEINTWWSFSVFTQVAWMPFSGKGLGSKWGRRLCNPHLCLIKYFSPASLISVILYEWINTCPCTVSNGIRILLGGVRTITAMQRAKYPSALLFPYQLEATTLYIWAHHQTSGIAISLEPQRVTFLIVGETMQYLALHLV